MRLCTAHNSSLVLQKLVKRGLRVVTLLPYRITSAKLSLWQKEITRGPEINGSLLAKVIVQILVAIGNNRLRRHLWWLRSTECQSVIISSKIHSVLPVWSVILLYHCTLVSAPFRASLIIIIQAVMLSSRVKPLISEVRYLGLHSHLVGTLIALVLGVIATVISHVLSI